jgi:hypothetical protein
MKINTVLTVLVILGLALFSGCADSMHIWLVHDKSAENKLIAIEERIGDELKTGGLSPDESQVFMTTLKDIRIDCAELRDKNVYQEKWNSLHNKINILKEEIDRARIWTSEIEKPSHLDKIAKIQKNIDNETISGNSPPTGEREFQASRLDSIRRDYLQMTEGDQPATDEERGDLFQRLDSLAMDISRGR